ncbi:hypothetical protein CER19_05135 [Pseudomonas sp. GL93]|uniref:sensor histidine kinase n=1 Tax=Pseudomonas sp. GL93 TaxID=2014741 RepID=UPI000E320A60|nr:ATP-binding protein [Pseudomonas sp. GL93]RFD32546.1 hypothetical protein CER19_05135 [Pseudomonas sp. GL93]
MSSIQLLRQKIIHETVIIALFILPALGYLSGTYQWSLDQLIYDNAALLFSTKNDQLLNIASDPLLIKKLPEWINFSISSACVLTLLTLLSTFQLRRPFFLCLGLIIIRLTFSLLLLFLGWWSAPSIGMLGIFAAYAFWNWRRLNAVVTFHGLELSQMDHELKGHTPPNISGQGDEAIANALAVESLISHVHNSQRFIMQSLESLPLAIFIVDPTGIVKLANTSAACLEETPEYTSQPLMGQNIFQVLLTLEQPRKDPQYHSPWSHSETSVERLDGQFIHATSGRSYKMQLARLDTEKSELTGWILIFLDLTVEHLAKEQCTSMVRFLSHDLRAPQSAILALLEMQQKAKDRLPHEELRRHIEHQVERTLFLTDGFIQLAEIRSKPLTFEPVFIGAAVLDAIDQIWPLAKQKSIRVEHTFTDDDTCVMNGSEELLTRAVFNLLENAVKYSEPNTVIRITLAPCDAEIVLTVSDEGRGISKEDLPSLFDEFSQFGIANTRGSGYGLGMAIVRNVVQRHNAKIECNSQLGVGTTFTLFFRAA